MTEPNNQQPTNSPQDVETPGASRRRYFARIPVEIPMRVSSFRFTSAGTTVDISVHGLQVKTRAPLTHGDRVIVSFESPEDHQPLNFCAEVVRVDTPLPMALAAGAGMRELLLETARLSRIGAEDDGGFFGLRIMKDDGAAWQNFVRMHVLER
ncbi:MAG: PilZ domain-containing protein [Blastocatellia bacterium]